MGLDDLTNNAKKDKEESKTSELSEKLGVEDKEDLEDLDERLNRILELVIKQNAQIEELKDQVRLNRNALAHMASDTTASETEETNKTDSGGGLWE